MIGRVCIRRWSHDHEGSTSLIASPRAILPRRHIPSRRGTFVLIARKRNHFTGELVLHGRNHLDGALLPTATPRSAAHSCLIAPKRNRFARELVPHDWNDLDFALLGGQ